LRRRSTTTTPSAPSCRTWAWSPTCCRTPWSTPCWSLWSSTRTGGGGIWGVVVWVGLRVGGLGVGC